MDEHGLLPLHELQGIKNNLRCFRTVQNWKPIDQGTGKEAGAAVLECFVSITGHGGLPFGAERGNKGEKWFFSVNSVFFEVKNSLFQNHKFINYYPQPVPTPEHHTTAMTAE